MPWTYVEFEDGDIHVVIRNAQRHLMGLTVAQSASAKVATSNQRHGNARSIVVWKTEGDAPPPMPQSSNWTSYVWESENDYFYMYNSLVAALNRGSLPDGVVISPVNGYYSLISMSNMQDGIATVSIFFRV